MALQCFFDAFNIGTGAAASTVVRTGYGFQPRACLYWWTGRTESAATVAERDVQLGLGFATSASNRACVTTAADDPAADMVTARRHSTDACIECLTMTDALEGAADLQSFDSNGQTLVIDDAFVTNLRIHCLALGGSDLTNATVVQFQAPSTTGAQSQDITTVGFQPNALILLSTALTTAPPSLGAHGILSLGVATGSSAQGVLSFLDLDAGASSSTGRYYYGSECLALQDTRTTLQFRAAFTSFLSTGFRLNWLEVGATTQPYIFALALAGGNARVGDVPRSITAAATVVETGLGFAPTGFFMFSSFLSTQSTQDTPTVGITWGVGGASSPTARGGQSMASNNNAASQFCGTAIREDACLWSVSGATTTSSVMDVQSLDSDGMTFVMDVGGGNAGLATYLAFGSGAAAPVAKAPPPRRQVMRFARSRV